MKLNYFACHARWGLLACLVWLICGYTSAGTQALAPALWMPMNGQDAGLYAHVIETVVQRVGDGEAHILLLSSEPLIDLAGPRAILTQACQESAKRNRLNVSCLIRPAPVFSRAEASAAQVLDLFQPPPTAVLILGNDPARLMQTIGDSPVEESLQRLQQTGMLIAGIGAPFSRAMLVEPIQAQGSGLNFGSIDLWNGPTQHGFSFGLTQAIVEASAANDYPGNLLNALALPNAPGTGLGLEAGTGAAVQQNRVGGVFGLGSVSIFDADSFHAAEAVQYHGERHWISLRNVLFHSLPPGDFSYNLQTRQHSQADYAPFIERNFEALRLPSGAGTLWLAADLVQAPSLKQLQRFINLAGGKKAHLLVVAAGYSTEVEARNDAGRLLAGSSVTATLLHVAPDQEVPIEVPLQATGVVLIGNHPNPMPVEALAALKAAWLRGLPLLADQAGAAILGDFYTARPAADGSNAIGTLVGLSLLNAVIEPNASGHGNWTRFSRLAAAYPDRLALGLTPGALIEINAFEATAGGENGLFILDLRGARLDLGQNRAPAVANGLLDLFAPGEVLRPQKADINTAPGHAPTPVLPGYSPTIAPSATSQPAPTATLISIPEAVETDAAATAPGRATKAPRPTATPMFIPPPSNPDNNNLMIAFSILAVVVVLAGVWLNRRRTLDE